MAANTAPVFPITPNNGIMNVVLTTGSNTYDGTNGNNKLIYTAGANGGILQKISFKAIGNNVATVARLFINISAAGVGTASNNSFFKEWTLPTTSGVANAQTQEYEFTLNKPIAPNNNVYVQLGTTVASGYAVQADGGDF